MWFISKYLTEVNWNCNGNSKRNARAGGCIGGEKKGKIHQVYLKNK